MISEIFILSRQFNVLVTKNYRHDSGGKRKETFIQKAKEQRAGSLPPHFTLNSCSFYHVKRNGLYFVATSMSEVSPILVIELLSRLYHICKDFCGIVNEDAVRANILLVYELLDEILDFGYIQLATTEKLKPYIQSEPVMVGPSRSPADDIASRLFGIETRVAPSSAANKPVVGSTTHGEKHRNEIFVDVIERLVVVVNQNGTVSRMEINGSVNMRNFLLGSPQIKMALNEDLTISREGSLTSYGDHVHLDKCSFHQCVKLDKFEEGRELLIHPPVGEFSILTYSVSGDVSLKLPFRLLSFVGDAEGSRDMMVMLRLHSEFPENTHAVNVIVRVPVPGNVSSVSQHLSGPDQTAEYRASEKQIIWNIKKFPGTTEMIGQFRLINQTGSRMSRQEVGPVALEFEISGHTTTGLQIRFLRVFDRDHSYVPFRWVRYITVSDSFIVKV